MHWLTDTFSKIKASSGFLFIIILMSVYFTFYAVKGERGFARYIQLNAEVAEARQISQNYSKEKAEWEEKVRLLSSESLDLDMLDERARIVLNMVGSDEFVILDEEIN